MPNNRKAKYLQQNLKEPHCWVDDDDVYQDLEKIYKTHNWVWFSKDREVWKRTIKEAKFLIRLKKDKRFMNKGQLFYSWPCMS